jgi:hypothetical protein
LPPPALRSRWSPGARPPRHAASWPRTRCPRYDGWSSSDVVNHGIQLEANHFAISSHLSGIEYHQAIICTVVLFAKPNVKPKCCPTPH